MPVPDVSVKLDAVIAAAVTSRADVIVIAPSAVPGPEPTAPPNVMSLVPAVRPKLNVPFSVPPKVMASPAAEFIVVATLE